MQTLALLGERSAALVQYESCRALPAEELGVEPSAETEALAATIRDQPLQTSAGSGAAHPLERPRLTVPFVGRARELAGLTSAYRRALRQGIQVGNYRGLAAYLRAVITKCSYSPTVGDHLSEVCW